MYAGIGYYTLPALIHGNALHVFACEWNPNALFALRHNIQDNCIEEDRVTILEGDCRTTVSGALDKARRVQAQSLSSDNGKDVYQDTLLLRGVDRISLGLLPSSEGGWETAIRSLRRDVGGWLHIHGNVPQSERNQWIQWVCIRLFEIACNEEEEEEEEEGERSRCNWIVIGTHVEKVKSFAPRVHHYVADIFVGPTLPHSLLHKNIDLKESKVGMILESEGRLSFVPSPGMVDPPSCALDKDGVLNQEWMMCREEK
eukprot:7260373-Ditylum_brightwellii.AAC.1